MCGAEKRCLGTVITRHIHDGEEFLSGLSSESAVARIFRSLNNSDSMKRTITYYI